LTIKIGERIVTKMVTVNDLVQKSFEVINKWYLQMTKKRQL
jgi:hypothetical protein